MRTTITAAFVTTHDRVSTVVEQHGLRATSIVEMTGDRPLTLLEVADSHENRELVKAVGAVLHDHLLSVRVETMYLGGSR